MLPPDIEMYHLNQRDPAAAFILTSSEKMVAAGSFLRDQMIHNIIVENQLVSVYINTNILILNRRIYYATETNC